MNRGWPGQSRCTVMLPCSYPSYLWRGWSINYPPISSLDIQFLPLADSHNILGLFLWFVFKQISLALSLAQVLVLLDFHSPIRAYTYSLHFLPILTLLRYLADICLHCPNDPDPQRRLTTVLLTNLMTFSQSSISAPLPYQPPPNSPFSPF